MEFITDHLLTIVIIAVAFFVIIPLIKSLISKLIIGAVIIGALVFFGVISLDTTESGAQFVEEHIQPVVMDELQSADFDYNSETKEYTVQSRSFHLKGTLGQNTGEIRFKKKTYPINVSFLEKYIREKIEEETVK